MHVTERIEPNPDWEDAYLDGYARFRALYPALRPLTAPSRAGRDAGTTT